MKKLNKVMSLSLMLCMVIASGCQDYVEGINKDPDSGTDAPLTNMIIASQVLLGSVMEGSDARNAAIWTQQTTGEDRQYLAFEVYNNTAADFDWSDYMAALVTIDLALKKPEATGNPTTTGMLKVMKAHSLLVLTSCYGDMPFTQLIDFINYPDPVFDSQFDIYQGVDDILVEAIDALELAQGALPADIFYNFNGTRSVESQRTAWLEAAHTLRARAALHLKDYALAVTEAQLGISTVANNMTMTHGDVIFGNTNIWYDFQEVNRAGYMGASTARLPRMLDATQSLYRGNSKTDESERFDFIYTGAPGTYNLNTASGMFAIDASYTLLSFEETKLILAEALLKIGSPDEAGALAALNAVRGALRSMYPSGTYTDYVLTDFDPAGLANTGQATRQAALLDEIIEERYTSLMGQIEVWNDLKRLNNPLGLVPTVGTMFPQRFLIPTDEVTTNSNVPNPLPELFDKTPVNQ